VVYNGDNNEFVRTNTLVKGEVIQIDATPFRLWYESHYGRPLGGKVKRTTKKAETAPAAPAKKAAAPATKEPKKAGEKKEGVKKAGEKPAAKKAGEKKGEEKKPAEKKPAEKKGAEKKSEEKKVGEKKPAEKAAGAPAAKKPKSEEKEEKVAPAKKAPTKKETDAGEEKKRTTVTALARYRKRQKLAVLDPIFEEQIASGGLLAIISSRPGQHGTIEGYLLEGKELEFYLRKAQKKKGGK
jgi:hypothetical protein